MGSIVSSEPYPADLYAALHRGLPGDVDFYMRACSGGQTVLELGCGYGRVLAALALAGHEVTGLERDPELARRAREAVEGAGGRVVEGDMTDFSLGTRFDRIIIPFNGLYCLLSPEEVAACFRCVAAHLAPDGLFIFDGWAADAFHAEASPDDMGADHLEPVGCVRARGRAYDVFETSAWDRDAQRIDARYLYVARDGSPALEFPLPQRYLRSDEAVALLEASGLEPWVLHGGFDQSAYDEEDSELMIVTARLP